MREMTDKLGGGVVMFTKLSPTLIALHGSYSTTEYGDKALRNTKGDYYVLCWLRLITANLFHSCN